ncbi:hypothetical protein [Carnobacterium antarcticum]|uniref:Transposase n=1 Tax=Carnobacterium antarcticum TaxID=2126436 RepID=A0ABW4NMJ5_9LACT|nr:hypothetical protein [Carnobacterium sp. CP1]ALV20768.1 hypothetical protein NY10_143 [Carnobacterium sp. CP1]
MNEKVVQSVISEYAMEVANLKIAVATLQVELEELKATENKEEKGEVK